MSQYDAPASGGPTIVDPNSKDLKPYERWRTEVSYAEKELEKFKERGRRVLRRYVDERDAMDSANKWFNLFHANTNILKSALYAQIPRPEVKRKFDDYNDDIARVAANILQRCIMPDGDDPRDNFDAVMKHCVMDRLLPGLATAFLRLETDVEDAELVLEPNAYTADMTDPNMGFKTGIAPDEQAALAAAQPQPPQPPPQQPPQPGQPPQLPQQPPPPPPPPQVVKYQRITDQRVCIDYVFWEDFLWSPCRVWEERRWVGRAVYLDKPELIERFGEEKGGKVPLNYRPTALTQAPQGITPKNEAIQRAKVYEIWDRTERKVIWFSKDYPELLDSKDDILGLIGFEPCPEPLLANVTTSNTTPRPDYYVVQDQYTELDTVNNRISMLVQACKVVGVYDRASDGVQRMLNEGFDNQLIPVDNWSMFAEKGGVKGQVDWLPLEQVVNALQRLYEAREAIKAQIYELTGIADIIRGASKASETLGAQEIKAKFASIRIKDIQDSVAIFASQILRIKAELMIKHFEPEIMLRKSNIRRTDDAQLADQAIAMLQSEEGFEWRILVTSDQLAQADYDMEKQDRIELLTTTSTYMQQGAALMLQMPQAAPLVVGLLKWAVSGFKGAKEIEGMLDKQLQALLAAPPEPPKPDPAQQKAEAQIQAIQMKGQQDKESHQMDLQGKQMGMMMDMKQQQADLAFKMKEHEMNFAAKQQETQSNLAQSAMTHQQAMEQTAERGHIDAMVARMRGQQQVENTKNMAKAKPKAKP